MSHLFLALGFDDERPYGKAAEGADGERFFLKKAEFTQQMNKRFDAAEVPRTHFLLGRYIEECRQYFGKAPLADMYVTQSPYLELQQHSYSHRPFRPLDGVSQPIMSPVEFVGDVLHANQTLQEILDITPTGLRTPYGYAQDLADQRTVLQGLRAAGITQVSSHLRSGADSAVIGPNLRDGQPHSYGHVGYSDIVEVPSHGLQDVVFTREKVAALLGRDTVHTSQEIVEHYTQLLDEAKTIEAARTSVALCLHPWAVMEYDPKVDVLMQIVDSARDRGFQMVSYGQMADLYRAG